jgi:integrase
MGAFSSASPGKAFLSHFGTMSSAIWSGVRCRTRSPKALGQGLLARAHCASSESISIRPQAPPSPPASLSELTSLGALVQPETFRAVLRRLWEQDRRKLSAYTHGIAITLIAIAADWVKASPEAVASLKALQKKLGTLPSGLTENNERLLRTFDDPNLLADLLRLPDQLWRQARRSSCSYAFVGLQTALAIDILVHVPLRMQNLSAINFDTHLHWPQGPRKPALITFRRQETKNDVNLKFELSSFLADRLQVYRNDIAPAIVGRKPDTLFVTPSGKLRSQAAVSIAIHKAILRHLGVKLTPHQFRHLCAKAILDRNPGAWELVRQMLGHTSAKTTANFYAGIDTLRAGRAHAELVNELRQSNLGRRRNRHSHRTKD